MRAFKITRQMSDHATKTADLLDNRTSIGLVSSVLTLQQRVPLVFITRLISCRSRVFLVIFHHRVCPCV